MSLKSVLVQYACVLVLSIQAATLGFIVGWPSYTLQLLESEDSPLGFTISKYESNLVGSIPMIGSLVATPIAGYVCEGLGRKKSHILARLLVVLSWCLLLTAKNAYMLLIGRFIIGFGSGLATVFVFVHVVEITTLFVRGPAINLLGMMYNVGILVSYVCGWFFSYDVICYIGITGAVFYILLLCASKETPAYLLRCGREKEALESLKFYRGTRKTTDEILREFAEIKSHGEYNKVSNEEKSNDPEKEMLQLENGNIQKKENPWKLLWTVESNRRAIIFLVVLMLLTVVMGMAAVQSYAAKFLTEAVPSLSADLSSVLLAVVFIVAGAFTMLVTNMYSRRFLSITSSAVSAACLLVLSSLMRWSWGPAWVTLLLIMLFCVAFHVGNINIVMVQLSESFGPDVNSTASAAVICSMFIGNFILLSLFVPSVEFLGMDVTFFILATICVVNVVAAVFFLKETRNVPLEDIQRMFAEGYLYKKSNNLKSLE